MSFSATFISQQEQAGNHWLVSATLHQPLPQPLGLLFTLEGHASPLGLFSLEATKIQLLTTEALPFNSQEVLELTVLGSTWNPALIESNKPTILLGSELGIGPLFYLARQLKQESSQLLALLSSQHSFPFVIKPAQFMVSDFAPSAIGAAPLLEDWGIANRLAHPLGLPGCFDGSLVELFAAWAKEACQTDTPWRIMGVVPHDEAQAIQALFSDHPQLELHLISYE